MLTLFIFLIQSYFHAIVIVKDIPKEKVQSIFCKFKRKRDAKPIFRIHTSFPTCQM